MGGAGGGQCPGAALSRGAALLPNVYDFFEFQVIKFKKFSARYARRVDVLQTLLIFSSFWELKVKISVKHTFL